MNIYKVCLKYGMTKYVRALTVSGAIAAYNAEMGIISTSYAHTVEDLSELVSLPKSGSRYVFDESEVEAIVVVEKTPVVETPVTAPTVVKTSAPPITIPTTKKPSSGVK